MRLFHNKNYTIKTIDDVNGNVPDKYFDLCLSILDFLFNTLNIRSDIESHLFVVLMPYYILQDPNDEEIIGPSIYYDNISTCVVCAGEYDYNELHDTVSEEKYVQELEKSLIYNVLLFNLELDGYLELTSEQEIVDHVSELMLKRRLP